MPRSYLFHRCLLSTSANKWIEPEGGYKPGIEIYNPITRGPSPLVLRNPEQVFWYSCGPTVYDSAHIGHASSYIRIDIMQRILRKYFNLNLITAMNITDIDDKIIKRALTEGTTWSSIAEKYETEFWSDMEKLNVTRPDIVIHVTKNMNKIIQFISKLVESGHGYLAKNGSVNFRTESWEQYGKMVKLAKDPTTTEGKQQRADFALWKAAKENEPSWPSPWGPGRPGWHIECSTLASHLFGNSITFHAGGVDLKFPHHENEEAQSCCYHKQDQWVDYWVHTGPLRIKGQLEKMSKSLKNTVSISQLLENYSADEFRMFCLLSRYRSTIEFDDQTMQVAKSTLKKLNQFLDNCQAYVNGVKPAYDFSASELLREKIQATETIISNFSDDFNTPKAIESLISLITYTNSLINVSPQCEANEDTTVGSNVVAIQDVSNFVQQHLENLGLRLETVKGHGASDISTNVSSDDVIESIVRLREKLRNEAMDSKDKNLFKLCDLLRDNLKQNGVEVKDHGKCSSWHFVK